MEIKFENVNYNYTKINYEEKKVLSNINFSVKTGTINSIIGPNGCGKTTLLELISLLMKPTNGKIKIDQVTITNKTENYITNWSENGTEVEEVAAYIRKQSVYGEASVRNGNYI